MEDRERANLVQEMLDTRGWREVVLPALEDRRGALMHSLLGATEHIEFVRCQQAVNAIDNLLTFTEEIRTPLNFEDS